MVHTGLHSHVSFNPQLPSFPRPFLSPSPQAVAAVLNNPNEPVSDLSYFDCLDLVINKSKVLGEAGAHITTHAKKGDHEQFGKEVENTSLAVCQLTKAASQAAYLVGIADPSSTAAIPGLVDQNQFARASQAILMACQNLLKSSTQQQVRDEKGREREREREEGKGSWQWRGRGRGRGRGWERETERMSDREGRATGEKGREVSET